MLPGPILVAGVFNPPCQGSRIFSGSEWTMGFPTHPVEAQGAPFHLSRWDSVLFLVLWGFTGLLARPVEAQGAPFCSSR